jgi:hypothetical protein
MPSRRTRRLSRTVAGALAVAALAAPAASARPILEPSGDPGSAAPEASAPTITPIADQGFEWGSAAVGAGSAAAVLLLAAAGATTLSRRHHGVGAIR